MVDIVLPEFGEEEEDGMTMPAMEAESGPEITLPELGADQFDLDLPPDKGSLVDGKENAVSQFFDAFEGYGTIGEFMRENSVLAKAGGMILETALQLGGQSGKDWVEDNREVNRKSDVYRNWQPQIWALEDQMSKLPKTSPAYQAAWEQLKETKSNMALDVEGNYTPETPDLDFGQIYDTMVENPGRMAGEVTKALVADPALLMVPAGALKAGAAATQAAAKMSKIAQATAKVTAQMAGAGGTAALWGAGEDMITQLDENPDAPIDFDRVANSAAVTGVFGGALPAIPALAKGLKAGAQGVKQGVMDLPTPGTMFDYANQNPLTIGESMNVKAIEKLQRDAQDNYLNSMDAEGNPTMTKQLAVDKAIAKAKPEQVGKLQNIDTYMNDVSLQRAQERLDGKGMVGKSIDNVKKAGEGIYEGWNNITQPITSSLRNRGYGWIAGELNKHDMNVGRAIQQRQGVVKAFSEDLSRLTRAERDEAAYLLNRGEYDELQTRHPWMTNSLNQVREMLDEVHNAAKAAGMRIDYAQNYFPREMERYDEFLESFGVTNSELTQAMNDRINARRKAEGKESVSMTQMTPEFIRENFNLDDIGSIMGQEVRAIKEGGDVAASGNVSNTKQKTISNDDFLPEYTQYYADPAAALHNYVSRMTPKIADREFFGGAKLNSDLGEYLDNDQAFEVYNDAFMTKNEKLGTIAPEDRDFVKKMLRARFVGGNQKAPKGLNFVKNMLYSLTLANPISATVQLGDVGASAFVSGANTPKGFVDGFINSFEGLGKIATNNRDFTMADMGLESIPELEAMDWSRRFLEGSMKISGFKMMDQLGKESILNANYSKLRKIMGNNKLSEAQKRQKFEDMYYQRLVGDMAPDDGTDLIGEIMEGVRNGDKDSEAVRLAVYSDLTRVQPVSMSEMPAAYLNNPKLRLAYMLKTFTLKQIDLSRQEIIRQFSDGVREKNGGKVLGSMMAMGRLAATVGAANYGVQYMKDMIAGKDDVTHQERMTDTALRNYGLSEYSFNHLRRGRMDYFLGGLVLPPVNAALSPLDNAPIIGRPMREFGVTNWIGEQTGIEMLQEDR